MTSEGARYHNLWFCDLYIYNICVIGNIFADVGGVCDAIYIYDICVICKIFADVGGVCDAISQ